MINNRQAGRRRGRGGGNNGQRPGGGAQGNGSRIDNRARGNATQLYEKYKNMAADAQRAGDRVNTEYYLQFADHYFRVLSEQRGRFEEQQPRRQSGEFDLDGEEEFGEEGEPVRARDGWSEGGEAPRFEARDRDDRPRDDRPRGDDRPRDDRPREFRRDEGGEPRRNGNGASNNGGNGDGRQWQPRDDRQDGYRQERGDRPERPRDRRPEMPADAPVAVGGQHRADAVGATESIDARAQEVLNADRPLDAPAARRRGRPRRDEATTGAPVAEALGFELPPAIAAAPAAANDEELPKPRRRRARPDEAPTAAE